MSLIPPFKIPPFIAKSLTQAAFEELMNLATHAINQDKKAVQLAALKVFMKQSLRVQAQEKIERLKKEQKNNNGQ